MCVTGQVHVMFLFLQNSRYNNYHDFYRDGGQSVVQVPDRVSTVCASACDTESDQIITTMVLYRLV